MAVTNADKQGISVGGSPKAAAPGNVEGSGHMVARRAAADAASSPLAPRMAEAAWAGAWTSAVASARPPAATSP